jgi:uncharacterized membrane protein YeaQ/YmgE (transglycosylase-associated protein family)
VANSRQKRYRYTGAFDELSNPGQRKLAMNNLMDLGGGVGWVGTLIIGGLAGWIAERLTSTNMGILMNIVVGIIGAYIGAFLANAAGLRLGEVFQGWFWGNLIVAVVGAVLLLIVVRMFRSRGA